MPLRRPARRARAPPWAGRAGPAGSSHRRTWTTGRRRADTTMTAAAAGCSAAGTCRAACPAAPSCARRTRWSSWRSRAAAGLHPPCRTRCSLCARRRRVCREMERPGLIEQRDLVGGRSGGGGGRKGREGSMCHVLDGPGRRPVGSLAGAREPVRGTGAREPVQVALKWAAPGGGTGADQHQWALECAQVGSASAPPWCWNPCMGQVPSAARLSAAFLREQSEVGFYEILFADMRFSSACSWDRFPRLPA
jgi:hypothetical protein